MVDLVYYPTNLLFFDIPLLYYCINLRSSVIFYLSSGDILSLSIFLSNPVFFYSFSTVSELFCGEIFQNFVIVTAILLPEKLIK